MAVLGDREAGAGTVSLRRRDDAQLPPMCGEAAVDLIAALAGTRARGLELP